MATTPFPAQTNQATPSSKETKPRYKVVALAAHEDAANLALAQAAKDGYSTVVTVYVVTTPSSASSAFAVLEQ